MRNPLGSFNVFNKIEKLFEAETEYSKKTVSLLESIDKKLESQTSKSEIKLEVSEGSGKEVKVVVDAIGTLVEKISGLKSDSESIKGFRSIIEEIGKMTEYAKEFSNSFSQFSDTIIKLGLGVVTFSASLLVATPAMIAGLPTLALFSLTLFGMYKAFEDTNLDVFETISNSFMKMGVALVSIGAAFHLYKDISLEEILKAELALFAIGAPLMLIAASPYVEKFQEVSKGLAFAGLGILSLGFSIWAFSKFHLEKEEILLAMLTVGGIGLEFAILGKFSGEITKGSLVLGLSSLSMIALGYGFKIFSNVYGEAVKSSGLGPFEFLGLVTGSVAAIGAEMALAGAGAGFISLGALSLILASGALIALSFGLEKFKNLKFGHEDSQNLAFTLASVKGAFMGVEKSDGFFSKLGSVFEGAIDSGKMLIASAGYAAAGLSLVSLSEGLSKFKQTGFSEKDSNDLAYSLSAVSTAFASAGGVQVNPKGVWGFLFGSALTPNATLQGALAIEQSGKALTSIAKGLRDFQNFVSSNIKIGSLENPEEGTLAHSIGIILGIVRKAFGAIGSEQVDDTNFFGQMFGMKDNLVEEGIEAVRGAGLELKNIAEGLLGFIDLTKQIEIGDFQNPAKGTLAYALKHVLGTVREAFAAIGGDKTKDTSYFGQFFGFDDNVVAEGIDAVKGAGEELTNIAQGLKTFSELVDKDIDLSPEGKVAKGIMTTIGIVGDAFAQIGGKKGKSNFSFLGFEIEWDTNLVEKGIESVKGAGEELKNIAQGLKTFSEMEKPEKVADSMKVLLNSISDVLSEQGKSQMNLKTLSSMGFLQRIVDIADRNEKLNSVSESFKIIAKEIGTLKTEINGIDLEKLTLVESMFKNIHQMSKIEGGLSALGEELRKSIDEAFSKLIEFLNEFSGATKKTNEMLANTLKVSTQPIPASGSVTTKEPVIQPVIDPEVLDKLDQIRAALLSELNVRVTNL